jgi:hypothetical protein
MGSDTTYGEANFNPEKKGMTFEQAKDEVAKKHGYSDWGHCVMVWAGFIRQVEPFLNEAAELYATEKVKEALAEIPKPKQTIDKDGWYFDYELIRDIKESTPDIEHLVSMEVVDDVLKTFYDKYLKQL